MCGESRLPAGEVGGGQCNRVLNQRGWLVSSDNNTSPPADVSVSSLCLIFSRARLNLGSPSMTHVHSCAAGPWRAPRARQGWEVTDRKGQEIWHRPPQSAAGDTDGRLSVCVTLCISFVKVVTLSLLLQCQCQLTRLWPRDKRSEPRIMSVLTFLTPEVPLQPPTHNACGHLFKDLLC